jgi:hypothetical protein
MAMPDPEPSDPSDYRPVNRIALVTESGLHEAVGFPSHIEDKVGPGGYVVNTDEPEATTDIVPELTRANLADFGLPTLDLSLSTLGREAFYACFYKSVRDALVAGKTPEEIQAGFLSHKASLGRLAELAKNAVEDALANRPMRYEDPFEA